MYFGLPVVRSRSWPYFVCLCRGTYVLFFFSCLVSYATSHWGGHDTLVRVESSIRLSSFVSFEFSLFQRMPLLRDTIVNRTCGSNKNLHIYIFCTNNIWSYLLWPPVILECVYPACLIQCDDIHCLLSSFTAYRNHIPVQQYLCVVVS